MTDWEALVSEIADAMHAAFEPWNSDVSVMIDIAYMERRFEKMAAAALKVPTVLDALVKSNAITRASTRAL